MVSSSRLMICFCILFIFFLCLSPPSLAFAWAVRLAPLGHTTGDNDALIPSTLALATPQFFRILVTSQEIVMGVEESYVRAIKLDPPIRFKLEPRAPAAVPPVDAARDHDPRHQLRSPETLLLRRTQAVVGKTFP
jgi:hypothetical protein